LENVDLLSASAHKIYGPKGVGLLMAREGVKLEPALHGGGHERGLRSGTENVPGVVGLGKAVELAQKSMKDEAARQTKMRDRLIEEVLEIEDSWLNGPRKNRLPNNANFGFKFVEGESLVLRMDAEGIGVSTGSACSSHDLKPSHVLTSIGLSPEEAHGSLRFSLGKQNTPEQVDYALEKLPSIISDLRKLSPLAH
jgi:cysteine desulfurase